MVRSSGKQCFSLATVLVIALCLSTLTSGYRLGGWISQRIDEDSSSRAFELLGRVGNQSPFVRSLLSARPRLVFSAQQLVNGMNHLLLYATPDLEDRPYSCVKIFEGLEGDYRLLASDGADSLPTASEKCGAVLLEDK